MTILRKLAAAALGLLLVGSPALAAQATINVGTAANDGTGDAFRTAFQKANANFSELYARGNVINIKDAQYGAKWDGVRLSDCTTANGSTTISCASGAFTAADVGKLWGTVASENVGSAPVAYTGRGTITAVNSATSITVSTAPTSAINGSAILYYGTDDTAALRAAAVAANPLDDNTQGTTTSWVYNRSGVIVLPAGIGMTSSAIQIRTGTAVVGAATGETILKWISLNPMAVVADTSTYAALTMTVGNGSTRIYKDVIFRDFTVDMRAAFVNTYNYHAKCAEGQYLLNPQIVRMGCLGSPATSWGYDFVWGGLVVQTYCENSGRLFASGGGGGSCADFQSNSSMAPITPRDYEASIFAQNRVIRPATSAFRFTNNQATLNAQGHGIITANFSWTDKPTGKCIEDGGNFGAIVALNTCITVTAQTTFGNTNAGAPVDQEFNAGITSYGGNGGSIYANTIIGPWYQGIKLYRFRYNNSTLMPNDYSVSANTVKGSYRSSIALEVDSGYSLSNVSIFGNRLFGAGGCAIWSGPTQTGATGQINRLRISGNDMYDNGQLTTTDAEQSGICLGVATAGLIANDNQTYDTGSGKQKYGLTVNGVAITGASIGTNDFSGVATPINLTGGGTIAGEIVNNKGYRLGPVAVTPAASPWTYTAGNTPETLYLTGGTVSSVVRNGVTVAANSNLSIPLSANDNVVVTYTAAPTAVADRR